jgi:signal transduction histidine kinase
VLATIPVQLVVPQPVPGVNPLSPIRVSLAVAWLFLLLAAVAMAVLLQGVVTLSERRAAFVSAVTHELRTPLTTFRMYAEMLQEGMVGGEAQKQHYLKTLQIEADRLAHLVENVLQYARLERGRQRRPRERVGIGDLLDRFMPRLQQRAEQAEMLLELEIPPEVRARCLITDAAAVEQILFNLVDNACKYAAQSKDRRIHLRVRASPPEIVFELADHGPGLSGRANRGLFRAFRKSAQQAADSAAGVGLGLALCRRLARQLGGKLEVDNGAGTGAVFQLRLKDRS